MELERTDFEHIRDYYLAPKSEWAVERVRRVIAAAMPLDGKILLDLGCGLGTFSFHAAGAGAAAVGLDRDMAALSKGIAAAAEFGRRTPRVRADAARVPIASASVDVVINADFIEHVPDDAKLAIFREMFRVLRTGGKAVVYSPNVNRVEWELRGERLKRVFGVRRNPVPTWKEYVDPDHFGMTDPSAARALLAAAGFKRIEEDYFEFHAPLFSRIPGFDVMFGEMARRQFSNRFLLIGLK